MNRKLTVIAALLVLFTVACGTMNKATPAQWDKAAMEADVRSKIASVDTSKTFAVEVSISDNRVVTLEGHADSQDEINKIVAAARSVDGVTGVVNNLHVQ